MDFRTELPIEHVPFDDFVHNLVFEIDGITAAEAADYIRKAAIDFARRTMLIRRRWYANVQECVTDYYLKSHAEEEVLGVAWVKVDGVTAWHQNQCSPVHDCVIQCQRATAARFEFRHPDYVSVRAVDDRNPICPAASIEAEFFVVPSRDACSIDRAFYTLYEDALEWRAKSVLYAMAKKPWSNYPASRDAKKEYQNQVEDHIKKWVTQKRGAVNDLTAGIRV